MTWVLERDPLKLKARAAVNNAVRAGRLPRVRTQQCVDCNMMAEDYDHEFGYEEENWLCVTPRCRDCHNIQIQKRGEREYPPYRGNPALRRKRNERRRERKAAYHKRWAARHREQLKAYAKRYYHERIKTNPAKYQRRLALRNERLRVAKENRQ